MFKYIIHYCYFLLYSLGVIDAYSDLDCEVVFHTSYVAPDEGLFALHTHGGNTLELRCNAVVRHPYLI